MPSISCVEVMTVTMTIRVYHGRRRVVSCGDVMWCDVHRQVIIPIILVLDWALNTLIQSGLVPLPS